jgi:hypothetical protein
VLPALVFHGNIVVNPIAIGLFCSSFLLAKGKRISLVRHTTIHLLLCYVPIITLTHPNHHKNVRSIYQQNPSAILRLRGKTIKHQSYLVHIISKPLRNLTLTPVLCGKTIKHPANTIKQPYATMFSNIKTMKQAYATMIYNLKTM